MKLTKVTITGADNSTDPKDLVDLSGKYPFVEWGILLSLNHVNIGRPRFPNWEWLNSFWKMQADKDILLNSSVHLCGDAVRKLATENRFILPFPIFVFFKRIQLNFHGEKLEFHKDFLDSLWDIFRDNIQLIFQIDEVNDEILYKAINKNINVSPLFDLSHGAGISPDSWPKPINGVFNGYAGGIGPDNIKEQIEKISDITSANDKIWIDMETKVRSDNDERFDLEKVVKCLEIAKEYISEV